MEDPGQDAKERAGVWFRCVNGPLDGRQFKLRPRQVERGIRAAELDASVTVPRDGRYVPVLEQDSGGSSRVLRWTT